MLQLYATSCFHHLTETLKFPSVSSLNPKTTPHEFETCSLQMENRLSVVDMRWWCSRPSAKEDRQTRNDPGKLFVAHINTLECL